MEKMAESRRRPFSPGAQEWDQLRRTPSNFAPTRQVRRVPVIERFQAHELTFEHWSFD